MGQQRMDKPPTKAKPSADANNAKWTEHPLLETLDQLAKDLREAAGEEQSEDLYALSQLLVAVRWDERVRNKGLSILRRRLRDDAESLRSLIEADIEHPSSNSRLVATSFVRLVRTRRLYFRMDGFGTLNTDFEQAVDRVEEKIRPLVFNPDKRTPERVVRAGLRALGADPKWINNLFRD
jgi:hypothetical protein